MLDNPNYTFKGWGWQGGEALSIEEADKLVEVLENNEIKAYNKKCQKFVREAYEKIGKKTKSYPGTANQAAEIWGKNNSIYDMHGNKKYAHGTNYHDGGPAIVGDEGIGKYEAVVYPNGNMNIYGRNGYVGERQLRWRYA